MHAEELQGFVNGEKHAVDATSFEKSPGSSKASFGAFQVEESR